MKKAQKKKRTAQCDSEGGISVREYKSFSNMNRYAKNVVHNRSGKLRCGEGDSLSQLIWQIKYSQMIKIW